MDGPVRKSGVVVPRRLNWRQQMLAALGACFYWFSRVSWRSVWKDIPDQTDTQAPVIYCIWHDHLALALASYGCYSRSKWRDNGLVAMVSASGDGAFLTAVLSRFGIQTIRGSSSRRGPQVLLEAARWVRKGYSIAITPDGPRGPAHQIQDGVIYLAQLTGRPIVPISNYAKWKVRMKSWDRFQIPLPFSYCEFYVAAPIHVPRDLSDEERKRLRAILEKSMQSITID